MSYGYFIFLISVLCLTTDEIEAERSGWSATPNTQYHIQTDEGPERYFRYQTLNGQYRKEKRLEDGTVIGTEGWLDPLGYLRIKDYIADTKGYRILKSKMVFVGKDRPIEDAIAASKRVPAQSGILAKPRRPPNPFRQPELQDVTSNSIESKNNEPYRGYVPGTRRYQVPTRTVIPRRNYNPPKIDRRPILSADDYTRPTSNYLEPSYSLQTPYERPYRSSYANVPLSLAALQPPILDENAAQSTQPLAARTSSESGSYSRYRNDRRQARPTVVKPLASGNEYNSTGRRWYRDRYVGPGRLDTTNAASSARASPAHASDRSDSISASSGSSRRTSEYEFPPYDGHHTTADGFQYYLKTHYHEEEKKPDGEKSIGSFGYVDPFGIRRVVYYKSDPRNGFVHKKNNRYVGFNATPYDPLPIDSQ